MKVTSKLLFIASFFVFFIFEIINELTRNIHYFTTVSGALSSMAVNLFLPDVFSILWPLKSARVYLWLYGLSKQK